METVVNTENSRPVAQRFAREMTQEEVNAISCGGGQQQGDTLIVIIVEAVDTETIVIIG
ncbi:MULTISPECIES: hypothetical protein [Xanthomonas]|uniref:hypothetical protein n=1 Tax=Xanthomonas TaxID=338 RepID=UPI00160D3214|nr:MULTISPECIES: hypothetical protein [Xanthomonas]MBB6368841.1 hypothetical protein [Xanthomonas sp. F10]MCI2244351.1 hypothetical protein [Xanthomonas indica]UYC12542.1 hypothetical protein NUG21_01975 [Xanthomonas sp. CFBP 8445]